MTAVIAVFPGAAASAPRAGILLAALQTRASRRQRNGADRGPITPLGDARSEIIGDGCLSGILAA